jgi:hypothetical protein
MAFGTEVEMEWGFETATLDRRESTQGGRDLEELNGALGFSCARVYLGRESRGGRNAGAALIRWLEFLHGQD